MAAILAQRISSPGVALPAQRCIFLTALALCGAGRMEQFTPEEGIGVDNFLLSCTVAALGKDELERSRFHDFRP